MASASDVGSRGAGGADGADGADGGSLFTATYLFILCCRHPPEMVVRELLRAVASADHHRRDGRTRTGRPCAPVASAVVCRGHELQKKGVQRSGA